MTVSKKNLALCDKWDSNTMKIPLSAHNHPFSAVTVPASPRKMSLYSLLMKQSLVTELTMRFCLISHKVRLVYRHACCLVTWYFICNSDEEGVEEEDNRKQVWGLSTVEPLFNVLSFSIQFEWSQINNLSGKFPSFKISFSLVFKYIGLQRNLKLGLQCLKARDNKEDGQGWKKQCYFTTHTKQS